MLFDPLCCSGFWVWTWWYEMNQETHWIPTRPARSVCSGRTRPHHAVSTTGYKRRRHDSNLLVLWVALLHSGYPFKLISVSVHCLLPWFYADAAAKPGNEASDPVQHGAHLQFTHEPEKLCMQHWRRCWAANVSLWPWPVRIHQVSSSLITSWLSNKPRLFAHSDSLSAVR